MSNEIVTSNEETTNLSHLPEALQAKILAAATRLKENSAVSVKKIRNDQKSFALPDGDEVEAFTGVIVVAKHTNMRYPTYVEGSINSPDCFALLEGSNDASCMELIPHASVVDPKHTNCKDCPSFQWKSAANGKGKDCSEYVMLVVNIPALGDELYLLECKKGNAKKVDDYISNVTSKYGHPIAVNTMFEMGKKGKWEHSYTATNPADMSIVANLATRMDEGNAMIDERVKGAYRAPSEILVTPPSDTSAGREARKR